MGWGQIGIAPKKFSKGTKVPTIHPRIGEVSFSEDCPKLSG